MPETSILQALRLCAHAPLPSLQGQQVCKEEEMPGLGELPARSKYPHVGLGSLRSG